jgi:hypothetical protein
MSLNVLEAWPTSAWPDGARQLAEALARSDPDARTQQLAGEVLRGADADE